MTAPTFRVADPSFSIQSDAVRQARDEGWYAHTDYGLAVLRYAEAQHLLKSPQLRQGSAKWPAHNGVHHGEFARWWSSWMLNLEGQDHDRLRRLSNPAFSTRYISSLVPDFQRVADGLIADFEFDGTCEFMEQFAAPYAATAISIILGADDDAAKVIAREATTLGLSLAVTMAEHLAEIESALEVLTGLGRELIADRRARPRDDMITRLIRAREDEDRLSEQELLDLLLLLVFGGFDTTRNQLGLAMAAFARHPDQWALLRAQPDLARAAVEEVMRTSPTTTWVTREAWETFEFEGLVIPAGTTVHLWAQPVGSDPAVIDGNPGFDITATRPPHIAFGGGIHFCLGAALARIDMREALVLLSQRIADPVIGAGATWLPLSGNTGPITLPIDFTPNERDDRS